MTISDDHHTRSLAAQEAMAFDAQMPVQPEHYRLLAGREGAAYCRLGMSDDEVETPAIAVPFEKVSLTVDGAGRRFEKLNLLQWR